uniref:Uncharacterized protein n=1 Tax=Anguilla anguilla TaxID=7936 RepID=A0A0E9RMQ3_ANGAN
MLPPLHFVFPRQPSYSDSFSKTDKKGTVLGKTLISSSSKTGPPSDPRLP